MILVDTSVWIRHLRVADAQLVRELQEWRVVTCDVVCTELALGSGISAEFMEALARLPRIATPSAVETRAFVNRHLRSFRASGVGWADAQIIAAAVEAGALLHSVDRAQRAVWRALGLRLA